MWSSRKFGSRKSGMVSGYFRLKLTTKDTKEHEYPRDCLEYPFRNAKRLICNMWSRDTMATNQDTKPKQNTLVHAMLFLAFLHSLRVLRGQLWFVSVHLRQHCFY